MTRPALRWLLAGGGLLLVAVLAASRTGPSIVTTRPSPAMALGAGAPVPSAVMDILRRACFDCHSEDTRWPWYARLPPASWLVARDVEGGRGQLNFSRWGEYNPFDRADMLDKACELVTNKKMPLWQYRLLHRESVLPDPDIAKLCEWTRAEADRLVGGGS